MPLSGTATTDTYGYPSDKNRLVQITRGAATIRTLGYDNVGNLLTDNSTAVNKTFAYNNRNRLTTATVGALAWTYTYNGMEQMAIRAQASPATTTHYIHDIFGNVIAETAGGGATGATGTFREYIWLPEAEIAPSMGSATAVDRPLAVVDAVNTASPVTSYVHVDHLHRPIKMTNGAKATVWDAVWLPWGGVHSITGSATMDTRFPGQWFQLETGLHYNWHRSYDPTVGRYTQPDPLGFVDGPSVYAYAGGSPGQAVDPDGRFAINPVTVAIARIALTRLAQEVIKRYFPDLDQQPGSASPSPDPGQGGYCPPTDRCKGLRDQLRDHQRKLRDYIRDPKQFDNQGLLGKGRDEVIIRGRVSKLLRQIKDFEEQLAECEKRNGM